MCIQHWCSVHAACKQHAGSMQAACMQRAIHTIHLCQDPSFYPTITLSRISFLNKFMSSFVFNSYNNATCNCNLRKYFHLPGIITFDHPLLKHDVKILKGNVKCLLCVRKSLLASGDHNFSITVEEVHL